MLSSPHPRLAFACLPQLRWHRVQYTSERFGNKCTTPCYTNCYGGLDLQRGEAPRGSGLKGYVGGNTGPESFPFQPLPACLRPLLDRVNALFRGRIKFNVVLTRLYFDGHDEIAWHTVKPAHSFPIETVHCVVFVLGCCVF